MNACIATTITAATVHGSAFVPDMCEDEYSQNGNDVLLLMLVRRLLMLMTVVMVMVMMVMMMIMMMMMMMMMATAFHGTT